MIDEKPTDFGPGLLQPALVAEFQAQTSAGSDDAFLAQLASLAAIPSPMTRDFLVDLLIDLENSGRAKRARSALPVVAGALTDENSTKRACLRLLVNLHFALAVLLMKEMRHGRPPSAVIEEWLMAALRYHYRHRCGDAGAGTFPTADLLARVRSATGDIQEAAEEIRIHELVEPRADASFNAPKTDFQGEPLRVSPPWLATADGVPFPAPHEAIHQNAQGFALIRDAVVTGCRSTVFFGDGLAMDDPLSNMAPDGFSPFGIESAYVGVVYALCSDATGKRALIARRPVPTQTIPCGIFLNGHYQYNYYHWLTEYLSQFTYVNEQAAYADWPLLISEEALAHPNHVELLQRLAGERRRSVVALRKDVAYRVGELLVPPKVARVTLCHTRLDSRPEDYAFSTDAIRRLHVRLATPAPRPWRRVFLGRKKNDRLLNQDVVRGTFEQAGFEAVFPEDLSFEAAQRLFGETAFLAGATGAAFTNLILCPPKTTAILMTTDLGARAGFFSAIAGPLDQRVIYLHGPGSLSEQTLSPFEIAPAHARNLLVHLGLVEPTTSREQP